MAINLKVTSDIAINNGVKILVYGLAGAGKTTLIKTLPAPVVLSAEGGLLSLRREKIPYVEIHSIEELQEVYQWLISSEEAKQFQSVALDSVSEIAEVLLGEEKKSVNDPRQAYGAMQDRMTAVIRAFRELPSRHVYFSAKVERAENELGQLLHSPSLPGKKMSQMVPYFFDEVLALQIFKNKEGETQRALMCVSDGLWTAKDRSGNLAPWEPADLGHVINKILGEAGDHGESNGAN